MGYITYIILQSADCRLASVTCRLVAILYLSIKHI